MSSFWRAERALGHEIICSITRCKSVVGEDVDMSKILLRMCIQQDFLDPKYDVVTSMSRPLFGRSGDRALGPARKFSNGVRTHDASRSAVMR
jgi:hypothetical protein